MLLDDDGRPATTTHEWGRMVDLDHLADVRARAAELAPGGVVHLLLEVIAYPAEEAAASGGGRCEVVLLADGSIRVTDDGRGTEVAVGLDAEVVRKPVMATKDVRFFDDDSPPTLPDGSPRRGMSVVSALSAWLEHTNRRADGAWTQRYERGVPVTDLKAVPHDGRTGTTVHLMPAACLGSPGLVAEAPRLERQVAAAWPELEVRIVTDTRAHDDPA